MEDQLDQDTERVASLLLQTLKAHAIDWRKQLSDEVLLLLPLQSRLRGERQHVETEGLHSFSTLY